jgi:hypothetical protein
VEFRSGSDSSRAFVISVSDNSQGLSVEDWAIEFGGCRPKTLESGTLGGAQAVLCTREVIEGRAGPAAIAQQGQAIFLISARGMSDSEFSQVTSSFRF